MRKYTRNTEYEGVANPVPPGQSIPKKSPRGLANAGSGTPIIPPPGGTTTPPNELLPFAVTSDGQTRNDGGVGITVKDLSTIQAALVQLGFSFPGGATDDNQWGIPIRIPDEYDISRPIVATLVVVGE